MIGYELIETLGKNLRLYQKKDSNYFEMSITSRILLETSYGYMSEFTKNTTVNDIIGRDVCVDRGVNGDSISNLRFIETYLALGNGTGTWGEVTMDEIRGGFCLIRNI